MTETEINIASQRLADIYNSVNNTRVDPVEKERLYSLSTKFPEIHYRALKINTRRRKRR